MLYINQEFQLYTFKFVFIDFVLSFIRLHPGGKLH